MPIKPENIARYPADWPAIRNRILARAKMRCEVCGLANGAIGQRDMQGIFRELSPAEAEIALIDGEKVLKVVLTIAHLDHTPENCADENLRAMCQQCHNRYDVNHRCDSRKVIPGQIPLFAHNPDDDLCDDRDCAHRPRCMAQPIGPEAKCFKVSASSVPSVSSSAAGGEP